MYGQYLEGEIESATHQKWHRRFLEEKAVIESELQKAEKHPEDEQLALLRELLPGLTNIKQLYRREFA